MCIRDRSKDKDFQSTAVRETCEELGINEQQISILGKLGTLVAPMGVIVEAYIGKLNINSLDELKIDTKEVEKIFIVPIDFFINNNPSEFTTRLELHPTITNESGDREELLPVKDLGCLLYTSDAADERSSVDLGGRRIIKKKKK